MVGGAAVRRTIRVGKALATWAGVTQYTGGPAVRPRCLRGVDGGGMHATIAPRPVIAGAAGDGRDRCEDAP